MNPGINHTYKTARTKHGSLANRLTPMALAMHLCFAAAVAAGTTGVAYAQSGTIVQADIPAGSLSDALNRFALQAGVSIVVDADKVQGLRTAGLKGAVDVEEGFRRLLKGSGYQISKTASGYVLINTPAAPSASEHTPKDTEAETLPELEVVSTTTQENAWGPAEGYVAKRSATATKTDTSIMEIPQSISIVTAQQIKDTKAMSLAEAMAYTPGIMPDWGYSNSYDVFYSRGFRLQDGNGGVYRDGLRLGASGWASGQQEPYGIERIELLKGASSVLFGAAAPGGILNVVTKQPHPDMVNEVKVEAGNYEHRALAADVGAAWSEHVAGRLVFLARNAETEVDHIPNDTVYLAPSLRFASEHTSLTLLAHFNERRTAYIYGVPVEGSLIRSPHGRIPRDRFIGEPGFDEQDTDQYSLGYLFTHEFSDALSLRHGARYLDSNNHVRFTGSDGTDPADTRFIMRTAYDELETTRGISTDTNLTYRFETGELKHAVTGGFDYTHHTIGSRWKVAGLTGLNVFNPTYGASPGPFMLAIDDEDRQRRLGVYVQDQIKFGGFTALIGGREDRARSALSDKLAGTDAETEETDAFSGRLGLVYEFDNGFAPFASYSESFEPLGGTDNNGKRYEPSRGEQYELGLRWQNADESFLASGAVYHLLQTNVLSSRPGLPKPVQTGEVLAEGFELEAKGRLMDDFSIIASYSYTDAEIKESEDASEIGSPQPGVPEHQAALWTKFENVWLPGLELGLGARYVGTTEDWNGTGKSVPSFVTFDTLLGYSFGSWNLDLNINNITDKDTMICSYNYCVYGDGRRMTATLGYRW